MKKRHLFLIAILFLFILSSCTQPYTKKYLRGYGHVEANILQGAPPSTLFYDNQHPEINDFEIAIHLKNTGASAAAGAIFIAGYDPFIMEIERSTPPSKLGICDITSWLDVVQHLGVTFGRGFLNIGFRCREESISLGIGNGGFEFHVSDIINFVQEITGQDPMEEFSLPFDVVVRQNNPNFDFSLQINLPNESDTYYGEDLAFIVSAYNLTSEGYGKSFILHGKNRYNPTGDEDIITFKGRITSFPTNSRSVSTSLLIDIVYAYSTFASADFCIDPTPYDTNGDVCRFTPSVSLSGGQGAPVEVYRIDQEYAKTNMIYTFYIRNKGPGRVLDLDALKMSPYRDLLKPQDLDRVRLVKFWVGNEAINPAEFCERQGEILLDENGEGIISCRLPLDKYASLPAFRSNVAIELWYGYEQTITKNILIKRTS